jgi:hypothetical protein
MNQASVQQLTRTLSRKETYWPDPTDEQGLIDAITGGVWALAYLAGFQLLVILSMMVGGFDAAGGGVSFFAVIVFRFLLIAVIVAIGWLVWDQQNFYAASLGLAWLVLTLLMQLIGIGSVFNMLTLPLTALAVVFAVNGLRGTMEVRRQNRHQA